MSLEEKALLLSGDGWWQTHSIDRLQIPRMSLSDGPHGLRKVGGGGITVSEPATCFPTASALASSWDVELIEKVGVALAEECQAHDVQILLGPGVNLKRSPLGGRNFEYFSEDPFLAGKMAAAYIRGVQSQGVGTSLKHYAANNQEFERMATSSNVDERTLRELYLTVFEIAVKEAQPWSVMAAYNLVNQVHATEDRVLLQDILRGQWDFEGFVVSDWGAVHDGVAGVNAGLSLEMPGSGAYLRTKVIEAVRAGRIQPSRLDEVVVPLLAITLKAKDCHRAGATFDVEDHHALARRAAAESLVLLKNSGDLLPLDLKQIQTMAVIGAFAKTPRYQGSGSSQVNPTRISTAYDELTNLAGKNAAILYADGYTPDGATTAELINEAVQQAKAADVAVVFAGLPGSYESEGMDRSSIDLPDGHNQLIEAVSAVQPNLVVVLMNGSAVAMPWVDKVGAIAEAWLGGQAGGGAIADMLSGRINPSGKLAETFPTRLEDTPAYPDFPGRNREANYGEGIFIGYRHYDAREVRPLFPFGFGLSYTKFAYSELRVSPAVSEDKVNVSVQLKVRNVGRIAGQEVVQLYLREMRSKVVRPEKELKAFAKITLQPGEEKTVGFQLQSRDFAYYDVGRHDWLVNSGEFEILVGASSRDLPLRKAIEVKLTAMDSTSLTRDSLLKEFRNHPKGKVVLPRLVEAFGLGKLDEVDMSTRLFLEDMPAYKVCAFSRGRFTEEMLNEVLANVQ
ncbi:MAG: glycoside hydrolase family 3 C-terminal domain-containing protein [Verrucomicrobia bacterium]|nr:glycoside hydrolase family 3 C-terminal domain-containing protein [Verrucomicrobiota bacterium]